MVIFPVSCIPVRLGFSCPNCPYPYWDILDLLDLFHGEYRYRDILYLLDVFYVIFRMFHGIPYMDMECRVDLSALKKRFFQ